MTLNFDYFDDVMKNGRLEIGKCLECGTEDYCCDSIYFNDPNIEEGHICLQCLKKGRVKVDIPEHIIKKLMDNLMDYYPNATEKQLNKKLNYSVGKLEATPPVAWIQSNDWQVCCGDFAIYKGEFNKRKLDELSPDGNGKLFFESILNDYDKKLGVSIDDIWEALGEFEENFEGGFLVVHIFQCPKCGRYIATWESY